MAPQPATLIDGTWTLTRRVGLGGTGEVWHAIGPSLMPVAIKFLRAGHDPRLDRLLSREIAHTARLSHPHVVDILAQGMHETHRFAVLEWMEGGTLKGVADDLSWPDVLSVLRAVLGALAHAHARGLLHLDVKPENIMCATVRPDWRLVDFGIAWRLGRDREGMAGTPAYMAPEQSHGRNLGPEADLYALGVTAWELIHGFRPFRGQLKHVLRRKADGPPDTWFPRFPEAHALEDWVRSLLAPDPEARPRSAAAALRALEAAAGLPVTPPAPQPFSMLGEPIPLLAARDASVAIDTLRHAPTMSGRGDLEATLWQRLRDTVGPSLVWLDGPPGVGRSRLARWLAETARESDAAVVLPDRPLRPALSLPDHAPAEEVRSALRALGPTTPILWVRDGAPSADDLALIRDADAPILALRSDGPQPRGPHARLAVPPVADSTVRTLLVGLLSLHAHAVDQLTRLVSGSLGTLLLLLDHLKEQGRLHMHRFRTEIDGAPSWPDRWTDRGCDEARALRDALPADQQPVWDVITASPPRFRVTDLHRLCDELGRSDASAVLARGIAAGLLWRDGDRVWWCDPLLSERLDCIAAPEHLRGWAEVEVRLGHPLAAAVRYEKAGAVDQAVDALAQTVHADGLAGQVWSSQRHEALLDDLRRRGARVAPALALRCAVARWRRRLVVEPPPPNLEAELDALHVQAPDASPVDTGITRLRAASLAPSSLRAARQLLMDACLQPWSDPSAFVDHMGFVSSIDLALGADPLEVLLDARSQLEPDHVGPRAWLDLRIAQALLADGRTSDALDRLGVYANAEGTDWAPAMANLLGEALRLSGRAEESLPHYRRSVVGYLAAGLDGWSASAVNLATALGMAGRPATALHLLTALGRRGNVANAPVLDTCRVAHIAANYAVCGAWRSTTAALEAYDALAARHEAVDREQAVALQIVLRELGSQDGPTPLVARVQASLDAMPFQVPDTWSP